MADYKHTSKTKKSLGNHLNNLSVEKNIPMNQLVKNIEITPIKIKIKPHLIFSHRYAIRDFNKDVKKYDAVVDFNELTIDNGIYDSSYIITGTGIKFKEPHDDEVINPIDRPTNYEHALNTSFDDYLRFVSLKNDISIDALVENIETTPIDISTTNNMFCFPYDGARDIFNEIAKDFDLVVELKESISTNIHFLMDVMYKYSITGTGIKFKEPYDKLILF